MISALRRHLRVTAILSRLSCAVAVGCALAPSAPVQASPSEPGDAQDLFAAQSAVVDDLRANVEQYNHRIEFAACPENASLDCGTLVVPVDYRKPSGKTVGIVVIRARATNRAKRVGVIVGNPGGPGISGVDFVLGAVQAPVFARLREHFDIVSFDPRGVSRSRGVNCPLELSPLPQNPDDAALNSFFDDLSERYARTCLEQHGSFVAHLGTMNTARDIDVLRRALGEKQITYAAGSYGSELGAVYASMFPERVRAMMLDGALGPEFRDYLVEEASEFSGASEMAFQRLDQLCRRDRACRLADTGVVATFDELATRLEAGPVPSPGGARLTHGALQDIVATLLDTEQNWPLIVDALDDARSGNYGLLFELLPFIEGQLGALIPIRCNDYGTRRPAAEYLPVDEAVGALHPRFFGRFFVAVLTAPCAAWPAAEPPVIRNVRNRMATPIMIISNDFDTRTPLHSARSLARALGMERGLLRYKGSGHTAFFKTTACIQDTAVSYLVDLRLPRAGFACAGQPISFAPSLQRRSADHRPVVYKPGFGGPLPQRLR